MCRYLKDFLYLGFLVAVFPAYTQCPVSSFDANPNYCQSEIVAIQNTSINAVSFEWDFCSGELDQTPGSESVATISGDLLADLAIGYDNGSWYGFTTDRNTSQIKRINFGADLKNPAPTLTNLGNPDGLLGFADKIALIQEGANWYGLVTNDFGSNNLVRLDFGSALNNAPSATDLGNFDSNLNRPRGIDWAIHNDSLIVAVTNRGDNTLTLLNFNNSILNSPSGDDVIKSSAITNADVVFDLTLSKDCDQWYGFTNSIGNGSVHRLSFGQSLFSIPSFNLVNGVGLTSAVRIETKHDGVSWKAFVTGNDDNLLKLDFSSGLANDPVVSDLNALGLVSNTGLTFPTDSIGFVINTATYQLHRIDFESNCSANQQYSFDEEPIDIFYTLDDTYTISLKAIDENGNTNYSTQSISIVNNTAPSISFSVDQNQCISNPNNFTAIDEGGLTYSWDFTNDGIEDDNVANPEYTFGATGDFPVRLTVSDGTCSNFAQNTVSIYPVPPTPDFEYSATNLCTNSEISFTNLTDSTGLEGVISYLWNFNGEATSMQMSPDYTFTVASNKTVDLTAMIPGCTTSVYSEDIIILDGPNVAFSYTNNCFGEAIQFTDASTGTGINSHNWDFGDGSPIDNTQNPTHTYLSENDFTVSLTVGNNAGCSTQFDSTITVSDDPLVDFSFGETIENVPVNFTGLDLTGADDSITTWSWDFDGLGSSNEQDTSFAFSSGTFTVSLDVVSIQGCSDSAEKDVVISESTCPLPDFIPGTDYCIGEALDVVNTSINATSFEWDFCSGELDQTPGSESVATISGDLLADLAIGYDNGSWYGFTTDRNTSQIKRINFGADLKNPAPTLTNLGNPDGLLGFADKIALIQEGANWYGLVTNDFGSNNLVRLDFGSALNNAPSATDLGNFDSNLNRPRGIDWAIHNDSLIVAVTNRGDNTLTLLNFNNSILNSPSGDDVIKSSAITNADVVFDLTLSKDCDQWYGFTNSIGNGSVHRLSFGQSLFSIPSFNLVNGVGLTSAVRIETKHDGVSWKAFVTGNDDNLLKLDFSSGLANDPVVSDLNALGLVSNTGLTFPTDSIGFVINTATYQLHRIDFESNCSANQQYSFDEEPIDIFYTLDDTYTISLKAIDENGNTNYSTQSISIVNNTAPSISFSVDQNQCISNPNNFTAIDEGGLTYSWDFTNDGIEDDNVANPEYTFGATGDFPVRLTVNDGTCSNFAQNTVSIYPVPPTPSFNLSAEPYCTNTGVEFTNTTDESAHEGASVNYDWDFNGEGSSQASDTTFTFLTDGTKDITLTMSIPGCATPYQETIAVIPGPVNSFSFTNNCFGETSEFTNETTGDNLINPFWDFGDGYTTLDYHPSHAYEEYGDYEVSMTMENMDGCVAHLTQNVRINGSPNVSFSTDLSCEGQSTTFNDSSIPGDDLNNVDSWAWDFAGIGSSTEENPEFLFDSSGDYQVSLTVSNEGGCMETTTQTVVVRPTPVVDFQIDLGCLNEETVFVDLTSTIEENPLQSWFWSIDGEIYTEQNASIIFDESGTYLANLIATGTNQCASFLEQTFDVFDLPQVEFEYENSCDNEITVFTDESVSNAGLIVSRTWQFDELGIGNGVQTEFQFSESGEYEIMLSVTDDLGCENQELDTITIHPAPSSGFDVSTDLGPPPLVVTFFNQSTGADSLLWQVNGENRKVSNDSSSTDFTFDSMGLYTTSLVASTIDGCSDTSYMEIAVAEPLLDLELTQISSNEVNEKINLVLSIRNNGSLHINGFDIRIDIDGQSSIYESYEEQLPRQTSITYPLNFSLPATGSNVNVVCIVLEDREVEYEDADLFNNEGCINFEQELIVEDSYPNPLEAGNDQLTLNMVLPTKAPVRIVMSNNTGMIVYDQTYSNVTTGLNTFLLDLVNYRKGMYFLKVSYGSTIDTQKIIKL